MLFFNPFMLSYSMVKQYTSICFHFESCPLASSQLEEDEEITTAIVNPCTRRETSALGDPNMRNLKQGEIIQLERKGYYRCDVPFIQPAKPIVLFSIPDGRQQSAAKQSFHGFRGHVNCKLTSSVTVWLCFIDIVCEINSFCNGQTWKSQFKISVLNVDCSASFFISACITHRICKLEWMSDGNLALSFVYP